MRCERAYNKTKILIVCLGKMTVAIQNLPQRKDGVVIQYSFLHLNTIQQQQSVRKFVLCMNPRVSNGL